MLAILLNQSWNLDVSLNTSTKDETPTIGWEPYHIKQHERFKGFKPWQINLYDLSRYKSTQS